MSQEKKKKEKNRKHQNKNAHVIKEEEEEECSDVRGFVDSYKFWTEQHHDAREDIPSTELAKTTTNTARLPKTHNYKTAENSKVFVTTSSLDLRKLQVSRRILLPAHNCSSILLFLLLLLYFFPWWFCLVRGEKKIKKWPLWESQITHATKSTNQNKLPKLPHNKHHHPKPATATKSLNCKGAKTWIFGNAVLCCCNTEILQLFFPFFLPHFFLTDLVNPKKSHPH